jgi:hypothetical protein
MRALALCFAALLAGCSTTHIRDAVPVHNPDASRVWFVEHNSDGYDRIIMCDVAMLQVSKVLCTEYRPAR